jgi:hypothetical protein
MPIKLFLILIAVAYVLYACSPGKLPRHNQPIDLFEAGRQIQEWQRKFHASEKLHLRKDKQIREQAQQLKQLKQVAEERDKETKLLNGSAWAVWSDLIYIRKNLSSIDIDSFAIFSQNIAPIAKHKRLSWISRYLSKQTQSCVESDEHTRPSIKFCTSIFGVPIGNETTAYSNHLLPHSKHGRDNWMPIIRFHGGYDDRGDKMQTRKAVNGVPKQQVGPDDKKLGNTIDYSSLVRGRPNMFAMKAGLELFDRNPSIGILPVSPSDDQERWITDGFEALVLAESPQQYVQIGATEIPMGMDLQFLTSLNSSVPEDLRKIKLAVASMTETCLRSAILFRSKSVPNNVSALTRKKAKKSDGECSADASDSHSEFVRSCKPSHEKYIREIHESIGEMGYLLVPNTDMIPENTIFRVVRFGPSNFLNSMPETGLHPAPIPHLLQQRNLNVLVNHLYKANRFPRVASKPGVHAAFWPSCLDLDSATGATCSLCRYAARVSLGDSGLGGGVLGSSFAAQALASGEEARECAGATRRRLG